MPRVLLPALCVALAAMLLAAPAPAARGSLFGVVPGTLEPSELARMHRGGVRMIRLSLNMGAIESLPGLRNWSSIDEPMANAATAGLAVLPQFFGVPTWMHRNPRTPPLDDRSERRAWFRFVRDAVARYGRKGKFWALHPELPYSPIKVWQVWNEPELPLFWGGRKASPRQYARLVRISRGAIDAADSRAALLLAGLFKYQTVRGSLSAAQFLKRLYRIRGFKREFEAVALHPYTWRPRGVIAEIATARRIMDVAGDRRASIWVDEFGWTTGGKGWAAVPWHATRRNQARRLRRTYRLMLRERKRLRLRRALWHTYRDLPPDRTDSWVTHFGLFTRKGLPKPAWYAYTRVAGGRP